MIVSLFLFRLGFWSGNLFLIAPFPVRCLLVPFSSVLFLIIYQLMSPTDRNTSLLLILAMRPFYGKYASTITLDETQRFSQNAVSHVGLFRLL